MSRDQAAAAAAVAPLKSDREWLAEVIGYLPAGGSWTLPATIAESIFPPVRSHSSSAGSGGVLIMTQQQLEDFCERHGAMCRQQPDFPYDWRIEKSRVRSGEMSKNARRG